MVKRKKWVFLGKSLQSVDQGKHVVDAKTFVLHLQEARKRILTQAEEEGEDGGVKFAGVELEAKEEAERKSGQESEDFRKNKFVILTSRQLSLSLFLEQLTDSDEASETKKQSILDSAASDSIIIDPCCCGLIGTSFWRIIHTRHELEFGIDSLKIDIFPSSR